MGMKSEEVQDPTIVIFYWSREMLFKKSSSFPGHCPILKDLKN